MPDYCWRSLSLSRSDSGSNIWGSNCRPPAILSDKLNAVSNQTRVLIHQVQLRYMIQQGLDYFRKCFIDSSAVEANTERPTDSTIFVKLIARAAPLAATCIDWICRT
jgi:hypothetical protein